MSLTIIFVTGAEHGDPALATVLAEGQNISAAPRVDDVVALPSGYYRVMSVVWNMVHTEGNQRVSINMRLLGELEEEPVGTIQ